MDLITIQRLCGIPMCLFNVFRMFLGRVFNVYFLGHVLQRARASPLSRRSNFVPPARLMDQDVLRMLMASVLGLSGLLFVTCCDPVLFVLIPRYIGRVSPCSSCQGVCFDIHAPSVYICFESSSHPARLSRFSHHDPIVLFLFSTNSSRNG